MESGSTSYCVYAPGNMSPSRPPLRRAAPEHARSGFPFLIGMAALVLAVGIGSVARFCPQDLKLSSGKHPAKSTPTTAAAITGDAKPIDPTPVITPTTFTTVGAPAAAAVPTVIVASNASATTPATSTAKKPASTPRVRSASSPAGSASAAASVAASGSPALPENPYGF